MLPICLPEMGTDQAVFSLRHVAIGDRVFEGERIAEVRLPGAVLDISAPSSGTIREWWVHPHDAVKSGQVLGILEPESDA